MAWLAHCLLHFHDVLFLSCYVFVSFSDVFYCPLLFPVVFSLCVFIRSFLPLAVFMFFFSFVFSFFLLILECTSISTVMAR